MYMKLTSLIVIGLLSCYVFASCLKDTPFLDVSNTAPIIQFGISPASGSQGPFFYAGDTASSSAIDTAVALVISSPQVLTRDVKVTVRIDPGQIAAFNSANDTTLALLPSNLYALTDSVITIKAGYRVGRIPIHLSLNAFPSPHFYGLPIVIVGTDDNQMIVSGNSSTFMWLFEQ
jgi:hypothetical protein